MTRQRGVVTDQAAVALALAHARTAGRQAHVVDLLIGLAEEPDGVAGRLLSERVSAVVALATRPLPPRLAPLDVAVSWAVAEAAPRPAGTGDLLDAALEVGGSDLADTLAAVDFHDEGLGGLHGTVRVQGWDWQRWEGLHDLILLAEASGAASETVGLRSPADPDPTLSPEAALAVARTRAMAAGSVGLLLAAAGGSRADALPSPEDLLSALATLVRRGAPEYAGGDWDRGLDPVVSAARTWRAPDLVTAADLVRAAAVAGGAGPAAVLAELERGGAQPGG